jgi:hypothetical protein
MEIKSHSQAKNHNNDEGGNLQAMERNRIGQAAEIHHELGTDAREDTIIHNAGQKTNETGEDSKVFAVSHFKKLGQSHRTRFTISIDHKSCQHDEQPDRSRQVSPPADGKARLIHHLKHGHGTDGAETGLTSGIADEISAAATTGRHKIRNTLGIFSGIPCGPGNNDKRNADN